MPEETLVYPAHDYKGETVSTIGEERMFNPRLQVKSIDEYVEIMNNLNLPDPKMMDIAVPGNLNLGISLEKQKENNGLMSKDFLSEIKNENSLLIDLREKIEIEKGGKIDGGIEIPFPKISEYLNLNHKELKNKKILFYCRVGHRSTLAVQISKKFKLENCYHLVGGFKSLSL